MNWLGAVDNALFSSYYAITSRRDHERFLEYLRTPMVCKTLQQICIRRIWNCKEFFPPHLFWNLRHQLLRPMAKALILVEFVFEYGDLNVNMIAFLCLFSARDPNDARDILWVKSF